MRLSQKTGTRPWSFTKNPDLLEKLSSDEFVKIRCEVADNPDTPGPVLAKLAFDMEEEVRRRALKNEKTAPALLKQFAREYPLGYALMMTDILYDWLKVSE